jgi:hypothetical protein
MRPAAADARDLVAVQRLVSFACAQCDECVPIFDLERQETRCFVRHPLHDVIRPVVEGVGQIFVLFIDCGFDGFRRIGPGWRG